MKIWIRQHLAASSVAAKQILSAPGNFFFNVLVVAVALSLPIAVLTLIENSKPISGQLSIQPELSLFLKTEIKRENANAMTDTIKKIVHSDGAVATVTFVPREKALATLEKSSELGDVLATLGDNPLPDAFVLSFEQSNPDKIEAIAAQLEKLPEVDHIQIDSDWIKRLSALMRLSQFVLIALATTLSIVVVTVVFNATRLQVLSHQAEISVIRLLGATNQYISRPYYYTGAFLGFAAGLAALGIVAAALQPMNSAITEFASLYGSEFRLMPLNSVFSAYFMLSSIIFGLFGAFLSIRHQVSRLN